jgi:hypothetical protein
MKLSSLCFLVFAGAALCAGCSDMGTHSMGDAGANETVCSDGTVLPQNSQCVVHGGVQSPRSQAGTGSR